MSTLKSNLLLLLTAAIWGFAFVAQRVGMEHVGPFTFNGVRFLLGSLSLLPLVFCFPSDSESTPRRWKHTALPGVLAGTVLFLGASLQQVGLVYTTAGKAAFVTGLYVVLVPVLSLFLHRKVGGGTWMGCILAVIGIYFLCIKESSAIQWGDLLELMGAFFWAVHILMIGYFSNRVDVLKLSSIQFLICSVLSFLMAVITETVVFDGIIAATVPILYGGICSVGIAYTLQAMGQKHAPPAHAAIILSMETVFGVIGGFLLLGEKMGALELFGCALMLSGMIISQLQSLQKDRTLPGGIEV